EHGLRIAHVLLTHNHADHLSGHGRLAAATGATLHAPATTGAEYEHEPLEDGSVVELGRARIVALRTPGHRPEHTAFVVHDRERAEAPWLLLTGDSLFVGDVARPDLAIEPEEGARELRRSLDRLFEHEDYVEVWPGHVGGSLCGGADMSEKPSTTLGFERRFNPRVALAGEEFTRALTSNLPPQPPSFRRIVELNRGPLITTAAPVEPLAPTRVEELLEDGAVIVDTRAPREFDAAHVPGSINVTAIETGVGTRAAWVVDPDAEVVVLAPSDAETTTIARKLEAVAIRKLNGFVSGGIGAWQAAGLPTSSTHAIDPHGLAERLRANDVTLLDVREDDEWKEGHVAGSLHVPYRELRKSPPAELSRNGKQLAVACSAGNRSSLAASLLERAGRGDVVHVGDGGIEDLEREGIELVSGA
ncbi:MAG TPA: MBL fold metallo-hydrolase, partial [Gaiellaceae bacterium]